MANQSTALELAKRREHAFNEAATKIQAWYKSCHNGRSTNYEKAQGKEVTLVNHHGQQMSASDSCVGVEPWNLTINSNSLQPVQNKCVNSHGFTNPNTWEGSNKQEQFKDTPLDDDSILQQDKSLEDFVNNEYCIALALRKEISFSSLTPEQQERVTKIQRDTNPKLYHARMEGNTDDLLSQRKEPSDLYLSDDEDEFSGSSCSTPSFQGAQCDMYTLNGEHNAYDPFNINGKHLVPITSLKGLSCNRANVPDSSQHVQEALRKGQPQDMFHSRLHKREIRHFFEDDPQVEPLGSCSPRQEVLVQQTTAGICSEQGHSTIGVEEVEKGDDDRKVPEKQTKNVCIQKEVEVINPDSLTESIYRADPLLKVPKLTDQHVPGELENTKDVYLIPIVTSRGEMLMLHHSINVTEPINAISKLNTIERAIVDRCGSKLRTERAYGRDNVDGWGSNLRTERQYVDDCGSNLKTKKAYFRAIDGCDSNLKTERAYGRTNVGSWGSNLSTERVHVDGCGSNLSTEIAYGRVNVDGCGFNHRTKRAYDRANIDGCGSNLSTERDYGRANVDGCDSNLKIERAYCRANVGSWSSNLSTERAYVDGWGSNLKTERAYGRANVDSCASNLRTERVYGRANVDGCGSNLTTERAHVNGWGSNRRTKRAIVHDCSYNPRTRVDGCGSNLQPFTGNGRNIRKGLPGIDAFVMKSGKSLNVNASYDHHNISCDQRMRSYNQEYELPYQDFSAVGEPVKKREMYQSFNHLHNLIGRKNILPAPIKITTDNRVLMPMKYRLLSPIKESPDKSGCFSSSPSDNEGECPKLRATSETNWEEYGANLKTDVDDTAVQTDSVVAMDERNSEVQPLLPCLNQKHKDYLLQQLQSLQPPTRKYKLGYKNVYLQRFREGKKSIRSLQTPTLTPLPKKQAHSYLKKYLDNRRVHLPTSSALGYEAACLFKPTLCLPSPNSLPWIPINLDPVLKRRWCSLAPNNQHSKGRKRKLKPIKQHNHNNAVS